MFSECRYYFPNLFRNAYESFCLCSFPELQFIVSVKESKEEERYLQINTFAVYILGIVFLLITIAFSFPGQNLEKLSYFGYKLFIWSKSIFPSSNKILKLQRERNGYSWTYEEHRHISYYFCKCDQMSLLSTCDREINWR